MNASAKTSLLALYTVAFSSKEAADAADHAARSFFDLPEEEEAREEHRKAYAAYDSVNTRLWGRGSERLTDAEREALEAEGEPLYAARELASERLETARAASKEAREALWAKAGDAAHDAASASTVLARAIMAAPHGQQPCGCFVTDRQTDWDGGRARTLHAPAKQGPLAEVSFGRRREPEVTALLSRAEARAIAASRREEKRTEAAAYEALRADAGRRLAAGEELPYVSGQNGGVVEIPVHGTVPYAVRALTCTIPVGATPSPVVSARGALVAAGLTREAADVVLADQWRRERLRGEACRDSGIYELEHASWAMTSTGVVEEPEAVIEAGKLLAAGHALTFCAHGAGYVRAGGLRVRSTWHTTPKHVWAPATEALIAAGMSRGAAEEHVVELLAAEATTLALPGAGEAIDIDDAHAARRERAAARAHRNAHKAA